MGSMRVINNTASCESDFYFFKSHLHVCISATRALGSVNIGVNMLHTAQTLKLVH
jgi:hypothetical protein